MPPASSERPCMATMMGKKVTTARRVNSRITVMANSNAIGLCTPWNASTREAVRARSVFPVGMCKDTSITRTQRSPGKIT